MTLKIKFNLMLLAVFLLALGASGYFSREQLNKNAQQEVLSNAGVLMETILSARNWAVNDVGPNLRETDDDEFLMMGVPAYAANKVMDAVRKRYPEYGYREVAINPANTKHLPAIWEKGVIEMFRANPELKEHWGVRHTPSGQVMFLARPLQIQQPGCLGCHTTPEKSPPQMVKIYGTSNGYGWKLKEIIGAQIVTVPMSVPVANAEQIFFTFMATLTSVFAALFVLINLMLEILVSRPLRRMAVAADAISQGNMKVDEFNSEGTDEVARLGGAFNRMRRSLEKAMAMFYQAEDRDIR